MEIKQKIKIINALRRLTYSWGPRNEVKKKQQVAPATYKCEHCGVYAYTGKKQLEKSEAYQQYGDKVILRKVNVDHINPVVDLRVGWVDWNTFIESLFCGVDNLQVLCEVCHKDKSKNENKSRKKSDKN